MEEPTSTMKDNLSTENLEGKLSAMQKALLEMTSSPSAARGVSPEAYLEALKKAPRLVETESDPLLFLRRERGNIDAACKRLFTYWTQRKEIFGNEQAFLPLEVGGAIGPEELAILKSGAFVRLPCDDQGRDVLCIDALRRPKTLGKPMSLNSRVRFFFYMFSRTFANPKTQSQGIVLLMTATEKSTMSIPNWKVFRDLVHHALPFKAHSVLIAGYAPTAGARSIVTNFLVPSYAEAHGCWCEGEKNVYVHVEITKEDLFNKLQTYGLKKEGVPAGLGGTWDYTEWGKEVVRLSSILTRSNPSSVTGDTKQQTKPEASRKRATSEDGNKDSKPPARDLKMPPPGHKKQPVPISEAKGPSSRNEIRSPPKKKARISSTEAFPVDDLVREVLTSPDMPVPCKGTKRPCSEDTLRKYGAAKAAVVERTDDQETKEAAEKSSFRKRMNVIYCRRKYYKRKLKFESLVNTHGSLLLENKSLQAENERLESLVTEARRIAIAEESGRLPAVARAPADAFPPTRVSIAAKDRQDAVTRAMLSASHPLPNHLLDSVLAAQRRQSLHTQAMVSQLGQSSGASRLFQTSLPAGAVLLPGGGSLSNAQLLSGDLQLLSNTLPGSVNPLAVSLNAPTLSFPLLVSSLPAGAPTQSLLGPSTELRLAQDLRRARLGLMPSSMATTTTLPPFATAALPPQRRSDALVLDLLRQREAEALSRQQEQQQILEAQRQQLPDDLVLQLLSQRFRGPPGL